jgi:hypothetical protein
MSESRPVFITWVGVVIRSSWACFNEEVVDKNGFDGCGGASRIGSNKAVPCWGGISEASCDGVGEDLIKKFDVKGFCFEGQENFLQVIVAH